MERPAAYAQRWGRTACRYAHITGESPLSAPVIVPATQLDCDAARMLRAHRIPHEVVLMVDDFSYGELITARFREKQTFLLVEHDIVPWPGALQELLACEKPWCGFHYQCGAGIGASLGCVKFGRGFLLRLPDLNAIDVRWIDLDGVVFDFIRQHTGQAGFHVHEPAVTHMHGY